jgi:hypothetical protein
MSASLLGISLKKMKRVARTGPFWLHPTAGIFAEMSVLRLPVQMKSRSAKSILWPMILLAPQGLVDNLTFFLPYRVLMPMACVKREEANSKR